MNSSKFEFGNPNELTFKQRVKVLGSFMLENLRLTWEDLVLGAEEDRKADTLQLLNLANEQFIKRPDLVQSTSPELDVQQEFIIFESKGVKFKFSRNIGGNAEESLRISKIYPEIAVNDKGDTAQLSQIYQLGNNDMIEYAEFAERSWADPNKHIEINGVPVKEKGWEPASTFVLRQLLSEVETSISAYTYS